MTDHLGIEDINIILTGFMGTGKSTVGRILAQKLGFEFVDTDILIVQTSGQTIPEIFANQGEAAFRQYERDAADHLAQNSRQIISTGGRMMLDDYNRQVLEPTGPIFCLAASAEEILRRVLEDVEGIERPLLKGDNPKGKILALLEERAPLYGHYPQIETEGIDPEQIAQAILNKINSNAMR